MESFNPLIIVNISFIISVANHFYKEIKIENNQFSKKKHASNKARKGTVVNPLRVPCYDDYSPLKAPD